MKKEIGRMQTDKKTLSSELAFVEAVQEGLRDVDDGRVVSVEDAKKRLGLM
jgi:predicted transcriptional regulator